jgi:hypothetical protein
MVNRGKEKAMNFSNCAEYAFERRNILQKLENKWNGYNRDPNQLSTAIKDFCHDESIQYGDEAAPGLTKQIFDGYGYPTVTHLTQILIC